MKRHKLQEMLPFNEYIMHNNETFKRQQKPNIRRGSEGEKPSEEVGLGQSKVSAALSLLN